MGHGHTKTAMHYGPQYVYKFWFPWPNIENIYECYYQSTLFSGIVSVWLYII
jgi:hypothetical protein